MPKGFCMHWPCYSSRYLNGLRLPFQPLSKFWQCVSSGTAANDNVLVETVFHEGVSVADRQFGQ